MSTCASAGLVEAMFDGRLGAAERASTERHLKSCEECRTLLHELSFTQDRLRASVSELTPLEHHRARLALLRKGVTPVIRKRRRAPLLVLALTLLPAGVWAAVAPSSPVRDWFTSDSASLEQVSIPSAAQPAASSFVVAQPTSSPTAASMPSLTATLAPSASAPSSTSRAIEPRVGARETSASRDFANAMAALAHGDFGVSARQLRHFAATYPQDARAEDARYLEAIALQRAGRGDEAKAAAQRYLSAYPQGVHSEQALRIVGN